MFSLSDYFYTLPPELIAQDACKPHHKAKAMIIDRKNGEIIGETDFWNIDTYIPKNRVLFFNNSKVLPARVRLREVLIENSDGLPWIIKDGEILFCQKLPNGSFEALVRPGNKFKIGTQIFLWGWYLKVMGISESGRYLQAYDTSIEDIMKTLGELPLPPYIHYEKTKEVDYQTSFGTKEGSVAAPTASLHFTKELLTKIPNKKEFITLHVGMWTFKPVDTLDIRDYHIHSELIEIPLDMFENIALLKENNEKILAVGTTVARTLESLPHVWKKLSQEQKQRCTQETRIYWDTLCETIEDEGYIHDLSLDMESSSIHFSTTIFIYPGKKFLLIDDLITNFHLPESSLLMLVSAFLEAPTLLSLYNEAIEKKYRFFSFWDGMYIRWNDF
jgi:S-adenosylmethionine:tRNA ribosyltransferase-isomerase